MHRFTIPDNSIKGHVFMRYLVFICLAFLIVVSIDTTYAQTAFPTLSIDWSPDNHWVVTTHYDNRIRVWNPVTGQVERSVLITPPASFQANPPQIMDVEWSPQGDRLAFIIRNRYNSLIRVINASTFAPMAEIPNNATLLDFVTNIEWSSDGTSIVAATALGSGSTGDYFIKVWNSSTGVLTKELRVPALIHDLEWNPIPTSQLVAFSGAPLAQVWNTSSDIVYTLEGHQGPIRALNWNTDGSLLLTKDDSTIKVWTANTSEKVNEVYLGLASGTGSVFWTTAGDGFIGANDSATNELYTVNSSGSRIAGNQVTLPNAVFDLNSTRQRVVVSPDSNSIVIYDFTGQIVPFLTPTPSNTPTSSNTPLPSNTMTPTLTPTRTPTSTPTRTPTQTPSRTPTPTPLPTSGWIAFTSDRTGNAEIYAFNPTTGYLIPLTNSTANERRPVWSPNRQKIVFAADRGQAGNIDLYVLDIATLVVTQIPVGFATFCPLNSEESWPDWVQSGGVNKLVFQSNCDGDFEIYTLAINSNGLPNSGTQSVKITSNSSDDTQPAWNENGTRIAFTSNRDGNKEIYKVNLSVASPYNPQRLTNNSASDSQPVWTPAGDFIGFTSNRNSDGDDEIYYMAADGTNVTRLTDNAFEDRLLDWSPTSTASSIELVLVRKASSTEDLDLYKLTKSGAAAAVVTALTTANHATANDDDPDW